MKCWGFLSVKYVFYMTDAISSAAKATISCCQLHRNYLLSFSSLFKVQQSSEFHFYLYLFIEDIFKHKTKGEREVELVPVCPCPRSTISGISQSCLGYVHRFFFFFLKYFKANLRYHITSTFGNCNMPL